jgi:hypothetical protein
MWLSSPLRSHQLLPQASQPLLFGRITMADPSSLPLSNRLDGRRCASCVCLDTASPACSSAPQCKSLPYSGKQLWYHFYHSWLPSSPDAQVMSFELGSDPSEWWSWVGISSRSPGICANEISPLSLQLAAMEPVLLPRQWHILTRLSHFK